ncbi:universal stress protein [Streptomyces sp. NBC_01264]|uniref:universal stress protein n=1 Tax=Streptomyces sp. NBC_01264 TaxID=2903804 RepID=UPI002256B4C0|nr:universal stress protein [Streptomyces sp. NBC_01264]MCX4781553.1 universal stress protein [Streptomyces sp. NBC_01264]
MKHHVTVGVDGSPESLSAARWGAREAALREVPLRLVHAVDWPMSPAIPGLGREGADRWADEALTEALDDVRRRHPGLEVSTRCLAGRPAAALAAEAVDAGLLVLGSRGVGGLVGFLIGSVSMSTLAATETPVALVRAAGEAEETGPTPYGEIVLGVDIHEAADRVLAFAFEEAARRGCALRAVHGWRMPSMYQYAPFFDPDDEREVGRSVTQMLDDMLLPWRHKFPSVRVTHQAFVGSAGPQLVQAASGADLVVVGRHLRRSPLGSHLGPVAHAVLHHATAPVAVIAHD